MAGNPAEYDVRTCAPGELTKAELAACVAIIKSGGAVDPGDARTELPRSKLLAVARRGDKIAGVGAIKRVRLGYASTIARRSGEAFAPDTPELGYVAVHRQHRKKGLSLSLAAAMLEKPQGRLFATTSSEPMKRTLTKVGFVRKGQEWKGQTGQLLSLWTKE